MALFDILSSVLARPAGRVVEGPVRELVDEIIRDHNLASAPDVDTCRQQLQAAEKRIAGFENQLATLEGAIESLRQDLDEALAQAAAAEKKADAAHADLSESRQEAVRARKDVAYANNVLDELKTQLELMKSMPVAEPDLPREPDARLESEPTATLPLFATETPSEPDPPSKPVAQCIVPGCSNPVRCKDLCSAHYQRWRRGTLKGFVSPDGLVKDGKRVFKVDESYAGEPCTISGRVGERKIRINREFVEYTVE